MVTVPTVTGPNVRAPRNVAATLDGGYLRAAQVDVAPLVQGLAAFGNSVESAFANFEAKTRARADKMAGFKALTDYTSFEGQANDALRGMQESAQPNDANFQQRFEETYANLADNFLSTLTPEQQAEYAPRMEAFKQGMIIKAHNFQFEAQGAYFNKELDELHNQAKIDLNENASFENLAKWQHRMFEAVDATDLTPIDKAAKKEAITRDLQTQLYRSEVLKGNVERPAGPDLPTKGLVEQGNIDLFSRPIVKNKDGTISTVRSISINEDGKEILIPTISPDGKVLTDKDAIKLYHDTGQHLGKFDTAEDATNYAKELHKQQEAFYKNGGKFPVKPGSVADIITQSAQELGIDPVALATVMSYETGGRFSTSIQGGVGGHYLGLIQFGPEEQQKYGVYPGQSFAEQMKAVVAFLKDRGLKPGMNIYDLYSTINAGSPGRYGASDRPGYTVQRHVDEMLASGHLKRAEALIGGRIDISGIDRDPRFGAVTYDDRIAAQADAERVWQAQREAALKEQSAAYTSAYNDLLFKLNNGSAGRAELDAFHEANDGMTFSEYDKGQSILEAKDKEGADLRTATQMLASGAVFDPTSEDHKKYVNLLVGKEGVAAMAAGDTSYLNNTLMPLVNRTGMIPTDISGTLQGMIRSQDARKALFALDTLSQLRNGNPRAFASIPDSVQRDVDLWDGSKGYMTQNQVLDVLRGGDSQEFRQARVMLRQEAQRLVTSKTDPDRVDFNEVINHFDGWFSSPDVQGGAEAKVVMETEFDALFQAEYVKDGNREGAMDRAAKQLERFWGVSELGGRSNIMKFPPEKRYRQVMGDYSWIEKQLRQENNLPEDTEFSLVSDRQTEAEFKGNRPPSYLVVTYKEGVPMVVMGADGRPRRQAFAVPPELAKQETEKFDLDRAAAEIDKLQKDLNPRALTIQGDQNELKARRDFLEQKKQELQQQDIEYRKKYEPDTVPEQFKKKPVKGGYQRIDDSGFPQMQ